MKQYPVFCGIAAAVGSPNQVMVVPSSELGDFLLADRAAPALFPPEVQQLPPPFKIVGHFDIEALFKVPLPGGSLRSSFAFYGDGVFDGHIGRVEESDPIGFTFATERFTAEHPVPLISGLKILAFHPLSRLVRVSAARPPPECSEDRRV
jgi:hypothetical protein